MRVLLSPQQTSPSATGEQLTSSSALVPPPTSASHPPFVPLPPSAAPPSTQPPTPAACSSVSSTARAPPPGPQLRRTCRRLPVTKYPTERSPVYTVFYLGPAPLHLGRLIHAPFALLLGVVVNEPTGHERIMRRERERERGRRRVCGRARE